MQAVELIKWHDYRRHYQWRQAGPAGWGAHVMEYQSFGSDEVTGRMLLLPPGQATPPDAPDFDTVLLGVAGTAECVVGDGAPLALSRLDLLGVPRGTRHRIVNHGLDNALVFAMQSHEVKPDPAAQPVHLTWTAQCADFQWVLPFAETWGLHRGAGPHLRLATLSGHSIRHPLGQGSPWHAAERDLLFIQIQGETTFAAAGRDWTIEPHDLLLIRMHTPYSYRNSGLEESLFVDMGHRITQASTYYAEDPGWPVRADARVLRVRKDAHGHARLVPD